MKLKKLKSNRLIKIILIILLVIILILLAVTLFMKFYKPFGGTISNDDKKDYANRASNYYDGKFHSEDDFSLMSSGDDENEFTSNKGDTPQDEIPIKTPSFLSNPKKDDLTITFLGHSSLLIQINGLNVLFDPVFSDIASPVSFIGPKRFSRVPIKVEDLPKIDIVIITHDHYDHLDYNTIKKLNEKTDNFIVPLGIENDLERWGINKDKITNLAWWEEVKIKDLTIIETPARHYSGRKIEDNYETLWASFVLKSDNYTIFESGDTGYGNHFKEISSKYGPFDLAMLDTGQYDVNWKNVHMTPKESVNAALDLNASVAMPIHYGAFKLANHPWDDPVEGFTLYASENKLDYVTPMIGQTVNFKNHDDYKTNWWKDVK